MAYVLVFFAGVLFGLILAGLCVASAREDDFLERLSEPEPPRHVIPLNRLPKDTLT